MSKRVLLVGSEPHEKVSRLLPGGGWSAYCRCGWDSGLMGVSSTAASDAWRSHVDAEAKMRGLPVSKPEQGHVVVHEVASRPVFCPDCQWQGKRRTPNSLYAGPAGPCPKCGAALRAIGGRRP